MSCLKDLFYVRYNDDFNVCCDNKKDATVCFDGNDLEVVVDKVEKKMLIYVPLTKAHSIQCKGDWLVVDGEHIASTMFWRECGCQVIEYQGDAPKVIADKMGKIKDSFKI